METKLTMADKVAMALGGGLILLGTAVFGFFEAILGNPATLPQTNEAGEVIAQTTFDPTLRAYLVAAGFLIWGLFAVYKLATGVPPAEPRRTAPGESKPAK